MELGLVLAFVSRMRSQTALDRALAPCDDACAPEQVPAVRVACELCWAGLAGNSVWRWILAVLGILHNGNELNGPVRL